MKKLFLLASSGGLSIFAAMHAPDWMFALAIPWLERHFENTNPFIFIEILFIFWMLNLKFKPVFERIDKNFEGIRKELVSLNDVVTKGFHNGEIRFEGVEGRVTMVEKFIEGLINRVSSLEKPKEK